MIYDLNKLKCSIIFIALLYHIRIIRITYSGAPVVVLLCANRTHDAWMTSRLLSDREYSVLCARGRAYAQSSAPALRAQRCVPLFTPPPPPPPPQEEEEEEEEEEKKKKQIKMRNIDDLRA